MTVIKTKDDTILSLKQEIGKLVSGKPRYKTYSYTNNGVIFHLFHVHDDAVQK